MHSSVLVWKTPWTWELGRLQSKGSQSQTQLNNCACTHDSVHVSTSDTQFLSVSLTHSYTPSYMPVCIHEGGTAVAILGPL